MASTRVAVQMHAGAGGGDSDCGPAGAADLMNADEAGALADVFKVLADPSRVRLLAFVAASPGGAVCACHLPAALGISQPTLSHHMKKLTEAGLVAREQRGRWAHYTVVPEALGSVLEFLTSASRR